MYPVDYLYNLDYIIIFYIIYCLYNLYLYYLMYIYKVCISSMYVYIKYMLIKVNSENGETILKSKKKY